MSAGNFDIVIMKYGATAVGDTPEGRVVPASNFPNPFNLSTTITHSIPVAGHVELEVYELAGRHVSTSVSDHAAAGEYQIQWNGTGDAGAQVASGVYLYQLRVGDIVDTKQMMLLKQFAGMESFEAWRARLSSGIALRHAGFSIVTR